MYGAELGYCIVVRTLLLQCMCVNPGRVCDVLQGGGKKDSGECVDHYGVASVSRIDKIIGLFCKRAL